MSEPIRKACAAYAQTLFKAKQSAFSEEDFWKNRSANRAYQQMFNVIKAETPEDVGWQAGFWECAGGYAEQVWEGQRQEEELAVEFANTVTNTLKALLTVEWIACVPMERLFQNFPEFTDFGPFALINARGPQEASEADLFSNFRRILTNRCGVNFVAGEKVRESYLDLAAHFYRKSGEYIPGRPQLVIKTGRGERRSNEHILRDRLRNYIPLLLLCQVVYETDRGILEGGVVGPHSVMPDGQTWMPDGLMSIPYVAVAINTGNGQADWWVTQTFLHEAGEGEGYDPKRFMDVWKAVAVPVLKVQDAGLGGQLRDAIDNATRLLAKCRHRNHDDVVLNAVIASETILNPFNMSGDIGERFSLLLAALTESTPEGRRTAYKQARNLYTKRCHAVHRSQLQHDGDFRELRKVALRFFLGSLRGILRWAGDLLAEDKPITREALAEFYLNSVFS